MINLSTLSKSYPYLSFARQRGLDYGDVLTLADMYSPRPSNMVPRGSVQRISSSITSAQDRHDICQLVYAVEGEEIGHG